MIWRSAVNILWALVRNTLQGKHQCILLAQTEDYGDWQWECSCGAWDVYAASENDAIKGFGRHLDRKKVGV
jgi:hypothetical protein